MNTNTYTERIEQFKGNEAPEVVLLIADDRDLTRIMVAWMSTAVRRSKKPVKLRGESEHDVWEWLWKNAMYSRAELVAKSAVLHGFERKLDTLIGNRIIYPDGSVNSFVQRYLREKVLKLFVAKAKAPSKKRA